MNDWHIFTEQERSQRQRISLSSYALNVLDNDIESYMGDKKNVTIEDSTYTNYSAIINLILENFYMDAEASIHSTLVKYETDLNNHFKDFLTPQDKRTIIDILKKKRKESLIEKLNSYDKGTGRNIRINNANYERFYMEKCPESRYYPRQGKYLKALIEEYAQLPEEKRERILCKDIVNEISSAIADHSLLSVELSNKTIMECKPYKIICSNLTHYNYLLALAKEKGNTRDYTIHTFRICRIKKVKRSISKSGKITADRLKEIKTLLAERDVSAITHTPIEIKIRLTKKGFDNYKKIHHLRPLIKPTDQPGIYTVLCSEFFAKNYFIRLLDGVEILSPKKLRDEVAADFERAARLYKQSST